MSKGASTSKQELPEWQKQQQLEVYQAGKQLAGTPFVPYTGPRVAGFNPDQLQQFQAIRGMFESGQQYDPMAGLQGLAQQGAPTIGPITGYQGATIGDVQGPQAANIQGIQGPQAAQIGGVQSPQFQGLLSQDIGAYQSPYQQQVIDQSMADIQRQADIQRGVSQDRAIGASAFGGSRSALLEGESQRPYIEQQARTAAGLRQSGFENAQQAAQSDLARQQQLGIFGSEQEQQRALQQAQFGQQAGLTGYQGDLQRLMQQGQFGQQAGLAGFEAQQQRAMRQAELGQQAGLAGQDIQARMNMMQPELELRNRQQQAGLYGGLLGAQQQNLANLGQIGQQQQGLQQAGLQIPYGEFLRSLAYGPQQFGLLQSGLGTPLINTTDRKRTGVGDVLGAVAGVGGSLASGGFFNPS
tara:strand:+ start:25 stop:1257 length:1233 start_codon:yes stop_codon:yes gene_type:complete